MANNFEASPFCCTSLIKSTTAPHLVLCSLIVLMTLHRFCRLNNLLPWQCNFFESDRWWFVYSVKIRLNACIVDVSIRCSTNWRLPCSITCYGISLSYSRDYTNYPCVFYYVIYLWFVKNSKHFCEPWCCVVERCVESLVKFHLANATFCNCLRMYGVRFIATFLSST